MEVPQQLISPTYQRGAAHVARDFLQTSRWTALPGSEKTSADVKRRDLLKRHITIHTSTELSGKKRNIRASQACSACAAIKVKCDQDKPCKRCHTKGLDCRVNADPDSAPDRENGRLSPVIRRTTPSRLSQQTTSQGQSVTSRHAQCQVSEPSVAHAATYYTLF